MLSGSFGSKHNHETEDYLYNNYHFSETDIIENINKEYQVGFDTAKHIHNFPEVIQLNLSKYHFRKLWKIYGQLVLLLALNILTILQAKTKEAHFQIKIKEHFDTKGLEGISELGPYH